MTPLEIAEQLGRNGLCVCPNYLSGQLLLDLHGDLIQQQSTGQFKRASIGQGSSKQIFDSVRRDEIFWWERASSNSTKNLLWEKLDSLQQALNRTLFLGVQSFEGHYAYYPAGGFYQRHRDSFPSKNDRIVSLVVYLNPDWKSEDGGRLRIYDKDQFFDIDPVGGTLVAFLSEAIEHEVCPSQSPRCSFTGWFKRAEPGE